MSEVKVLRERAAKARPLASSMTVGAEADRLKAYAEELEHRAANIEMSQRHQG